MTFLRSLLILGRVSNLPTVWTNVVVGWLVGAGRFGIELLWLNVGVSLLYWAGMTLNDAFDVKWDREHAPERPIPSGAISLSATWAIGLLQLVGGAAFLILKTEAKWEIVAGLIVAILAYDWIHKKWAGSVLIMGLCRSLVYLLAFGAARADMQLNPTSPLIFLIGTGVLLYIAGLTLAARAERDPNATALATLPRIFLLLPATYPALVAICEQTLDLTFYSVFGGLLVSCVWIVIIRTQLHRKNFPAGIGYAIAGIALYDATVAFLFDWEAGMFCALCFAATLIAQRIIPAT